MAKDNNKLPPQVFVPNTDVQHFDINEFILQYIPPFLRRAKLLGYVRALLAPLVSYRHTLVTVLYPYIERRARYNSQVIVFEKLLNAEFGYLNNEITLISDDTGGIHYTFNHDEDKPVYVSNAAEAKPVYVKNKIEYVPLFDFTVKVPTTLYNTKLVRLKSIINKYKLAGTTYTIIHY